MTRFAFRVALAALATCSFSSQATAQELLWPDGAPGAKGSEKEDQPALYVYRAEKARNIGTSVVVCPGGGYRVHAIDHEGQQIARFFNRKGITAFVLRYRLGPKYNHPAPLQDAQRAVRWVRHNADKLEVAKTRVGIMGFSAGGHLASTLATHFDSGNAKAKDPIDQESCKPAFAILGYPVVSLTAEYSHKGSGRNLLGNEPDPELLKSLSNDTQVTKDTPPTFLFHTAEDTAVPPENSIAFFLACKKAGVPSELHIYSEGPHGVGLADGHPVVSKWRDRLYEWMNTTGMLQDVERIAISGEVKLNNSPMKWGTIAFVPIDHTAPTAWAPVRGGKFSIPVHRGAVIGKCRVEIYDLGAVKPCPTIPDVQRVDKKKLEEEITKEKTKFEYSVWSQ